MPLISGARSHDIYLGKWDLVSEKADVISKVCAYGMICQLSYKKPEWVFPGILGTPVNVWLHQRKQSHGDWLCLSWNNPGLDLNWTWALILKCFLKTNCHG